MQTLLLQRWQSSSCPALRQPTWALERRDSDSIITQCSQYGTLDQKSDDKIHGGMDELRAGQTLSSSWSHHMSL